jgi:O-antigen/teichoic acid export membrane protein
MEADPLRPRLRPCPCVHYVPVSADPGERMRAAVSTSGRESWDPSSGLSAFPERSSRRLSGETAILAAGFFTAQLLLFVAGLVQKRLLGPQNAGYWALMATVWAFFSLASLGAFSGASRQVPNDRGREDYRSAAEAADTGGTFAVCSFAVAGILLALIALVFGASWAPQLRWGLVLVGLLAPLRTLVDFHVEVLRVVRRFGVLAMTLVLTGVLSLLGQTALVYGLGYYGMFAGLALISLGSLAFWWKLGLAGLRRPAFRFRIVRRRLRELILTGIPITLYGNIWVLFISIDTLLVASLLSVKELGYYSLAVSVTAYLLFLPRVVTSAVFPRMQEMFGASERAASVRQFVWDVPRVLAFVFVPLLVAAVFFLLPVLIRAVLPAFVPGIPALRIMVVGGIFLALADMPIEFLVTVNARWLATSLILGCLALNAVVNYIAIGVLDGGIRGAALATAGSYLALFLVMSVAALRRVYARRRVVVQIATLLAVSAQLVGALWLFEWAFGSSGQHTADLGRACIKLALVYLVMVPWFVYAERSYGVFARLRGLVADARRWLRRRSANVSELA